MNNLHKLTLLILLTLFACENINNSLNPFFDEFERKIENKGKLQKFKDAPREAVINYSENFMDEFNELYENPKYQSVIDNFLNKIEVSYDRITAEQTLIIAFQTKLNGQKINIDKIASDVYEYNIEFRKSDNPD